MARGASQTNGRALTAAIAVPTRRTLITSGSSDKPGVTGGRKEMAASTRGSPSISIQ